MPHVTCKLVAMSVLVTLVAGAPAGAQTLGFSQAREMVLTRHEGLMALAEEVAAAEAAVRQARAYPNPEIEVATEKFGEAEIEVILTQPLLIGGTRGAAINVAKREVEIAELTLESGKISAEAELARRFIPLLAAHRRLELVDSLLEVSAKSTEAVQRLVDAGGAMALDVVRSQLEGDELSLERAEIVRNLAEGMVQLGELWGDMAPGFDNVEGTLPGTLDLPPVGEVSAAMEAHPDLLLLEVEWRLIKAEMDEARAEGRPELALSAGYLRNNELDEESAITGFSFSLPIFDRNTAAVTAKQHEMAAAEHAAERERVERAAQLRTLYSEIEGTMRDLDALSGGLLSKATYVHRSLEEFYVQGKTGILDVLEARSHLLELRMRVLDLLEKQALLTADLVELTGYRIEIIN